MKDSDQALPPPPLDETELRVLSNLAEAWNQFLKLKGGHPDDVAEMRRAIHSGQLIIAGRLATRVAPQQFVSFPG